MPSRQNILIGIAIVLVLGWAYLQFFSGGSDLPLTAIESSSPTEQEFLNLAARLTAISFETKIFSDPRFLSLVDLGTPITAETQGRVDPFSPLGH